MIETINRNIEDEKACHIPHAIEPFGWEVVVKHLQECADEKYAGTPNGILSYQLNEAEEIPEVKRAIEYLNEELKLKIFDAHIFASFTTKTANKKHVDDHNVLLWSITGDMIVHLYPTMNDEDSFYNVLLEKGDLFYIPADVPHSVEPIGPRAVVSFGIEVEEGVKYKREVDNPYVKKGDMH